VPPGRDGIWKARITRTGKDGSTRRPLYSLGTRDDGLAKRRLQNLVAGGGAPEALCCDTVREYAQGWLEKRGARGLESAPDERRNLEQHVLPSIGPMLLADVRSTHIRAILEHMLVKPRTPPSAAAAGARMRYSRQTIEHVRGVMFRLFDAAWRDELLESNPVARVRAPAIREMRKERMILTDDEFHRFVACPNVDLELRMAALAARCEGGMRTRDLLRWDWTMIDVVDFAECVIPRTKRGAPQVLAIPSVLGPFLRAWWERAGKPASGPVFPVRRGPRAGSFQSPRGYTFADRLRAALLVAGVHRLPPIEAPAAGQGTRTDLGRGPTRTKLAANPGDPLFFETATTKPVDFHSFRRAFNTALAEAGVNVQKAMALAAHSDAKTHMRYVMNTRSMRTIPEAALPPLPSVLAVQSSAPVTIDPMTDHKPEEFQRAQQDSNLRPTAPEAVALSS